MKRFLIAAAFAMALGLGVSSSAHAQLVYGYSIPAYGGIESNGGTFTPYGPQNFTNFYSPYTGLMSQYSGSMNTLWGRGNYASYYTPYTGLVQESRGTAATPFGTMSFSNFYSPYTGPIGQARLGNSSNSTSFYNFGNGGFYATPSNSNYVPPWWSNNGSNGWHSGSWNHHHGH